MRVRGVLAGYLALVAGYVLVSNTGAAAAGGLLGDVGRLVARVFDPTVAGIPDHSGASSGQSTAILPSSAPAAPAPGGGGGLNVQPAVIPSGVRLA